MIDNTDAKIRYKQNLIVFMYTLGFLEPFSVELVKKLH